MYLVQTVINPYILYCLRIKKQKQGSRIPCLRYAASFSFSCTVN